MSEVSVNAPIKNKAGRIIGRAVVKPDGIIVVTITNKEELSEWINLMITGFCSALIMTPELIPAEETPRDQPLKEDRFGREPRG